MPPRRPDRRSDKNDRRLVPPRDTRPPAEPGDAKPARGKTKRGAAGSADAPTERPTNARAARAARFKAEHTPAASERPSRAGKPSADRGDAKPPRTRTKRAAAGSSDAAVERPSRSTRSSADRGEAKPPRAKTERPPSTTEGRRVSGAERAANARAARAARLRDGDVASPPPTREPRPPREKPDRSEAKAARARSEKPARETKPARPMRERPAAERPARAIRQKTEPDAPPPSEPPRAPRPTAATIGPRVTTPRPPAPRPAAAARREPQRIAKLLARAGIASRREIERMIAEGRVAIDGVALDTPATIITSLHGVTVDGVAVNAPTPARLFLFNKPTGFLTAERDPRGRPTIYDRLPRDLPRVMPVGRLDLNTEGLLLLTTDGELKRSLELPATGIPRIYRARAYGEVTQQQLEELIEGVEIDGMRYGQIDANLERRTGRNVWIEIKITEGKNREVRRVLEYLGLQVSRLIRLAYGPFVLADLPPGDVVEVRQHDLVAFRQTLR